VWVDHIEPDGRIVFMTRGSGGTLIVLDRKFLEVLQRVQNAIAPGQPHPVIEAMTTLEECMNRRTPEAARRGTPVS
jgi:hypothetical protein